MDAKWHVLLSGTITFGIPLALAIRELILLRRPPRGAWPGDGPRAPEPKPLPPDAPRRLPECLVPKLPAHPVHASHHVPEMV
jgi:hypothetical protein